jgi:hypothetical protein
MSDTLRIGAVIATVGREAHLRRLLESAGNGRLAPAIVVIANQSGRRLDVGRDHPFALEVIESSGGVSAGRNDGYRVIGPDVDLVSFPNDHSRYARETLSTAAEAYERLGRPEVLVGTLLEGERARFVLPATGTVLDRRTVWRAIEPALIFSAPKLGTRLAFDPLLGSGSPSPWQSGEGTDLLLRIIGDGGRIISAPEIVIHGPGERRRLDPAEYRTKVRAYARGTGYVYRIHDYPAWIRARVVVAPWYRFATRPGRTRYAAALAFHTSLGRLEGVAGRVLSGVEYRPR